MSRSASRTPKRISPPSWPRRSSRVAGSRIGRLNATSTVNAAGSSDRAPPGSGPWSTSRGRSPTESRSGRAVSGWMWIGFKSPRPSRSAGRGRRGGARSRSGRSWVAAGRRAPGRLDGCGHGGGWSRSPPRRARLRCGPPSGSRTASRVGAARSPSPTRAARVARARRSGRCWTIRLAMWTRPIAAKREAAIGHQRQVQRERQHVRIGRGELVADRNQHTRS